MGFIRKTNYNSTRAKNKAIEGCAGAIIMLPFKIIMFHFKILFGLFRNKK